MPDDDDALWWRKLGPCYLRRKATLADKQRSELITKKITQNELLLRELSANLWECEKSFSFVENGSCRKENVLLINKKKENLCRCRLWDEKTERSVRRFDQSRKEIWNQNDPDHEKNHEADSRMKILSNFIFLVLVWNVFPIDSKYWINIIDGSRCRHVA